MKKLIQILLLLLSVPLVFSQQVVNTTGVASPLLDFTVGELSTGGIGATQLGFIQPKIQVLTIESPYSLPQTRVACSASKVFVNVNADIITSGINGIDFCLSYDSKVMRPTGNATLGSLVTSGSATNASYYINTMLTDKLCGIIYFTGTSQASSEIKGKGLLISIEFNLQPGQLPGKQSPLVLTEVVESYQNNATQDFVNPATSVVTITPDFNLSGTLLYWGATNKPLRASTINTVVNEADVLCQKGAKTATVDASGKFVMNIENISHLAINRDIPGTFGSTTTCTNVLNWINGADQLLAMRIATLDPNFAPTVHQIIASDVNLDGRITAGDVTSMNLRSSLKLCGFNNNNGNTSRDWVFFQESKLTGNSFKISSLYPIDDQIGFSKNKLPSVLECVELPNLSATTQCISPVNVNYHAVLLGDVNGNWTSNNGTQLRKNSDNYIALDLLNATPTDSGLVVPVLYQFTEAVTSLDFSFNIDDLKLLITEIEKTFDTQDFIYSWNTHKNSVLLSSFTMDSTAPSGRAFSMFFNKKDINKLGLVISEATGYINGNGVDLKILDGNTITNANSTLSTKHSILIYPNPTKDFITIDARDVQFPLELSVKDATGLNGVSYALLEPNTKISLAEFPAGVYILSIKNKTVNEHFKIVKN